MLFSSYSLFFSILLFVSIFTVCKWIFKKGWLNNVLLLAGNILILTQVVSPRSLFWLSLFTAIFYFTGLLLRLRKTGWALGLTLTLLITVFALRNYPLVQSWFGETSRLIKGLRMVEKVGLSYILFRLIHWLVESYRQTLHTQNFFSFINYLFFFPTFMAGPIDTYNNFDYWVHKTNVRFNVRMLFAGIGRIFWGAVKTLLIVPLLLPYATDYQTLLPQLGPWGAVISAALLYSLYIYIDFSGYCDIAIGMAYMMGIRTPENFNNPYLSTNISEFWRRWHITFSTFLKIYVFKPVIALLNRFSIVRYRLLVSVIAYLVTFLVCGLWHGSTLNFVIWGLWHGVGLSVYKIFTHNKKPTESYAARIVGIVATFIFVTIGWVFFNYTIDQLATMLNILFS